MGDQSVALIISTAGVGDSVETGSCNQETTFSEGGLEERPLMDVWSRRKKRLQLELREDCEGGL